MADAVKIKVESRDSAKNKGTGSRVASRLRKAGFIPAIIYGHKQPNVAISLPRASVWEMIKKSTHLAELSFGTSTETVIVSDIQWDHLGKEIIHLDFTRVSADESIETEVKIDLRGEPKGLADGGTLEVLVHELRVVCRANAIPDSLRVDVSKLGVGQAIHVKDLVLPEGVKVHAEPERLVVHVVSRSGATETTPGEGAAVTQPEVIKPERKEKEG